MAWERVGRLADDRGTAVLEQTDWPQILALYGVLERMSENPLATLNRAVAAATVHGPQAGLDLLKPLDVRAHLLERAGEPEAAVALYRVAAGKTTSIPERNYLLLRAARLSEAPR
jgi:predicted RNA polymerase sigma factor